MSNLKQNRRGFLSPAMKSRDSRLRAAWLGICHPMRSRPEPRSPWDGAARSECPFTPWDPMQGHIRNAVQAAVATGIPQVMQQVRQRVEVFYATLQADALSALPHRAACILELTQSATREHAEASVALQRVLSEMPAPHPSSIESAMQEAAESRGAIGKSFDFLNAMLHGRTRPALQVHS